MVTEVPGHRLLDMYTQRGPTVLGAVAMAFSLPLVLATSAEATSVIGFGNSAHDNRCANRGSAVAAGATTYAAGVVSALTAGVPVTTPANQCGGLGSPLIDVAAENVLQCGGIILTNASCIGNNFQTGGAAESGTASGGGTLG